MTNLAVQHGVLLVVELFRRVQSYMVAALRLLILLPVLHLKKSTDQPQNMMCYDYEHTGRPTTTSAI